MARKIFVSYIILSIIIAAIASHTKSIPTPFYYDQEFTLLELLSYSSYILIASLFFLVAYQFGPKIPQSCHPQRSLEINLKSKKITIAAIAAQLFIFVYFLYKILHVYTGSDIYKLETYVRLLGGKETYLILLVQAAIPFLITKSKDFRRLSIAYCFFIGFLFAWLDASRSAVIPLSGILISSLLQKRHKTTIVTAASMAILYMMASTGRIVHDRASIGALDQILTNIATNFPEISLASLSYFTSFSIFQFSYVVKSGAGSFSFYDLVYSVTPIPSFLWPAPPSYSNWRIDYFRPMGATAELFRVSPFFLFAFFGVLGLLAKITDATKFKPVRILLTCMFGALCVIIFQYNLRTAEWIAYGMLIIYIADRRNIFTAR